jgi:uncharacterized protein (DUF2336 family)
LLKETGRINDDEVHTFMKKEKYAETLAGLASLGGVPLEPIERLAHSGRSDALLVPCKAAGLGWRTVGAIRRQGLAEHDLEHASSSR